MLHSGIHHHIQIRLNDVNLTAIDGIHRVLADIRADHLNFPGRKHRRRWQPDIAKPDHTNRVHRHIQSSLPIPA